MDRSRWHQLPIEWNDTWALSGGSNPFYQLFEAQVEGIPDGIGLSKNLDSILNLVKTFSWLVI